MSTTAFFQLFGVCKIVDSLSYIVNLGRVHIADTRDKTVLSGLQLRSHRQLDKTRQFCLVRVGGVNKPLAAFDL